MLRSPGLRLAALVLALTAAGACSSNAQPDAGAAASAEPLTPVPAPDGLVADLYVANPSTTWGKMRSLAGGPAMFLPQAFGSLVANAIGLPITMTAEFDETVPLLGALLKTGKEGTRGAIAVHVKAGDRFVAMVTKGEQARFDGAVDPATKILLLKAKSGQESPVALGVLGNYLLVGRTNADLLAAGPYVVRTLPTKPPPAEEIVLEVPGSALAGPVLDEAKAIRARGPGSQMALVPLLGPLDRLIGVLPDASHARVTLAIDTAGLHARARMTPKPGGGPASKMVAELPVGDAAPLLDLPESVALGLLVRDSAAERIQNATKQSQGVVELLSNGGQVSGSDQEAITAALRGLAEVRGDWEVIGATFAGTGPTLVLRAPSADVDKTRAALKQLVALFELGSFKETLRKLAIKVTADKAVVENLEGEIGRLRAAREADGAKEDKPAPGAKAKAKAEPPKPGSEPPPDRQAIDLLYMVGKEGVFAAGGYDPKDSLRALIKAPSGSNLRANTALAAPLAEIGGDASVVFIADAARIDAMTTKGSPPAAVAPVLVALGRSTAPGELWGRVDLPSALIQQFLHELGRRRGNK